MVPQAFSENLFYRTLTGDYFCIEILLREKCPNTEFFLVRIFPQDTHSFSTYVNFIENLFLLLLKICFIEKFLHKGVRIRGFSFWKILRTYQMNDPVYVSHGIFRDVQNNCFLAPLSTVDSVQLKIYTFF